MVMTNLKLEAFGKGLLPGGKYFSSVVVDLLQILLNSYVSGIIKPE
jgi:hypothetical protein